MTAPMLIRSITLSEDTSTAWKSVGGWFPRRERSMEEILVLYAGRAGQYFDIMPLINLGNTGFRPTPPELHRHGVPEKAIWNHGDNIRMLVKPGSARKLLNDLMPEYPQASDELAIDFWVKAPGSGGRGKTLERGHRPPEIPADWDLQVHVEGLEYRVVTVGNKVVQVNHRQGKNGQRIYQWVGVTDAPKPVKAVAKAAARKLVGNNIIGWDVIHPQPVNEGEELPAYILEGNSCPGVNAATAQRILNMIEGASYAS